MLSVSFLSRVIRRHSTIPHTKSSFLTQTRSHSQQSCNDPQCFVHSHHKTVGHEASSESSNNTISTPIGSWSVQQVTEFVDRIFPREGYAKDFHRQQIDGSALQLLSESMLKEELDMKILGHRLRLMQEVQKLQQLQPIPITDAPCGTGKPVLIQPAKPQLLHGHYSMEKRYRFEAGHMLVHHDGKCRRPHGHSYLLQVGLRGSKLQETGPKYNMLFDFSDVSKVVKPLIESHLDHHWLNDTLETDSPTAEFIATWVYHRLEPQLPLLDYITLYETTTSKVTYRPSE
eukprot:TRINITY_DN3013_c0_g4_i1.p1 TRINITY_DN3013_c0_g4~~TRINITY_DN3013_c0_g4_i1.p1  ORF type:complete len:287 (-),score=38.41 TRINITY_DN3013_c0_g4_i1:54-914(-)